MSKAKYRDMLFPVDLKQYIAAHDIGRADFKLSGISIDAPVITVYPNRREIIFQSGDKRLTLHNAQKIYLCEAENGNAEIWLVMCGDSFFTAYKVHGIEIQFR